MSLDERHEIAHKLLHTVGILSSSFPATKYAVLVEQLLTFADRYPSSIANFLHLLKNLISAGASIDEVVSLLSEDVSMSAVVASAIEDTVEDKVVVDVSVKDQVVIEDSGNEVVVIEDTDQLEASDHHDPPIVLSVPTTQIPIADIETRPPKRVRTTKQYKRKRSFLPQDDVPIIIEVSDSESENIKAVTGQKLKDLQSQLAEMNVKIAELEKKRRNDSNESIDKISESPGNDTEIPAIVLVDDSKSLADKIRSKKAEIEGLQRKISSNMDSMSQLRQQLSRLEQDTVKSLKAKMTLEQELLKIQKDFEKTLPPLTHKEQYAKKQSLPTSSSVNSHNRFNTVVKNGIDSSSKKEHLDKLLKTVEDNIEMHKKILLREMSNVVPREIVDARKSMVEDMLQLIRSKSLHRHIEHIKCRPSPSNNIAIYRSVRSQKSPDI